MIEPGDSAQHAQERPPSEGEGLRSRAEQAHRRARQLGQRTEASIQSSAEVVRGLQAEVEGLREAMASRAVIEQAKGIIMARENCDAEDAFRILVKSSQRQHMKLRDLAQQIVLQVDRNRIRSV